LWCFHCGAENQIADLTATARGIEKMYIELKRLLRAGTARYQQELLDEEAKTRHFRSFHPAIVPGTLQTPGYATVRLAEFADMVGIPGRPPSATVAARMERARLLLSGDRLFHVVLGEHALYAGLADRDVMEHQLRHLLEISRLPRLRLGNRGSDERLISGNFEQLRRSPCRAEPDPPNTVPSRPRGGSGRDRVREFRAGQSFMRWPPKLVLELSKLTFDQLRWVLVLKRPKAP
jgi:Domain of unknown function (DUF5753)